MLFSEGKLSYYFRSPTASYFRVKHIAIQILIESVFDKLTEEIELLSTLELKRVKHSILPSSEKLVNAIDF